MTGLRCQPVHCARMSAVAVCRIQGRLSGHGPVTVDDNRGVDGDDSAASLTLPPPWSIRFPVAGHDAAIGQHLVLSVRSYCFIWRRTMPWNGRYRPMLLFAFKRWRYVRKDDAPVECDTASQAIEVAKACASGAS